MPVMTIGEYVRHIREQRKLSLSELARQSGLHKSLLSRLENNKNNDVTVETARVLAATLGIPVAELIRVNPAQSLPQTVVEAELRVRGARNGEEYIRGLVGLHDAVKALLPKEDES